VGDHGIGRFARNILSRLPECELLESGPKPLSMLDPLWLDCQLISRRPRVFFSPGFNLPVLRTTSLVITIHDLAHIRLREYATYRRRLYYELLVKRASWRAYRVLTVSEYSRRDILEWTQLPGDVVVNVGNGVDGIFRPEGPRYEPGFPYLLYVGNSKAHKNLKRLLEAFDKIDCASLRLILTGRPTLELSAHIHSLRGKDRVIFIGSLTDQELAALYRGASFLILPSLFEGFGLPVVEAMASGTPVIASRMAALPEVTGEAGLLVDPLDVADIRKKMERMLSDAVLRNRLRQAGLARAQLFSWDTVAEKVRNVLQRAI
jgi:glycosyltransferase involved in cell wall biosynthesis